jgi:hypothetical protein
MENRYMVVLFGSSLLMDTVEASLEKHELGLLRMHTSVTNLKERLQALSPDLIIFDLDVPLSEVIISLLIDQPGTPLLGLDVTSSRVVVLSSRQHKVMTANELAHVILAHTNHRIEGTFQPERLIQEVNGVPEQMMRAEDSADSMA